MMRIARRPPPGLAKLASDIWTAPFWSAASRHELVLPRCRRCDTYRMPPTPFCPQCHSQDIAWTVFDGEARLYSYTVVDQAIICGMEDWLPYVPAIVEFPGMGGIRLISNLIDCDIDQLKIGAQLHLRWIDLEDGASLPAFTVFGHIEDEGEQV